jgi:hypothetical protein
MSDTKIVRIQATIYCDFRNYRDLSKKEILDEVSSDFQTVIGDSRFDIGTTRLDFFSPESTE